MRSIFAAAIMGGSTILAAESLPAQQTYEFSNVVELRDGIAAGDARLIDDANVSFTLMAPGLDLDWVEIRDREQGGTVLATTRSRNGRPPLLEILGMGEVLNDPDGGAVGIGFEDFLVELTLHAPGGGLERSGETGFVTVGFTDGQSAAFPILSGSPSFEDGALVMTEDEGGVFTVTPPEDEGVTGDPPGEESGRVAVARTSPSEPPAPLQGIERPPGRTEPQPRPAAQPPAQPAPQPAARPAGPGPLPPAQPAGPGPQPPAQPAGPGPQPTAQPTPPQGPAAGGVAGTDWNATATSLRGRNGEQFVFQCPPGGTAGRGPWGGDVYADHSSVCTAAVHAGLVSFASGGSATIEIRAGQDFYAGSPGQGGVTSSAAGGWPGSFAFVR